MIFNRGIFFLNYIYIILNDIFVYSELSETLYPFFFNCSPSPIRLVDTVLQSPCNP